MRPLMVVSPHLRYAVAHDCKTTTILLQHFARLRSIQRGVCLTSYNEWFGYGVRYKHFVVVFLVEYIQS